MKETTIRIEELRLAEEFLAGFLPTPILNRFRHYIAKRFEHLNEGKAA